MNITGILIACLVVGGAGIVIGVLLGIAGKKFAVEVDEKAVAIREALPGSNCGGCGYAGCDAVAAAIAAGDAPVNSAGKFLPGRWCGGCCKNGRNFRCRSRNGTEDRFYQMRR